MFLEVVLSQHFDRIIRLVVVSLQREVELQREHEYQCETVGANFAGTQVMLETNSCDSKTSTFYTYIQSYTLAFYLCSRTDRSKWFVFWVNFNFQPRNVKYITYIGWHLKDMTHLVWGRTNKVKKTPLITRVEWNTDAALSAGWVSFTYTAYLKRKHNSLLQKRNKQKSFLYYMKCKIDLLGFQKQYNFCYK